MILAPMLVATALAAVYLIWDPPSADLAAQTFRADLFADEGFAVWSNAWYAGHHLPGYSVVFPPLAAWFSPQLVGAIAAVTSAGLFGAIAGRRWGPRAGLGVMWFAAASAVHLLTGRLTFALGVALGLAALLALQRERGLAAAALAALTALTSPVAGLFLGIAGTAVAIARRPSVGSRAESFRALGAGAASFATIAALVLTFPVEGIEPFVGSAFWPVVALCAGALLLLPGDERALRWGALLYGLAAVVIFVIDNAVGGNMARLGALFGGPLAAVALAGRRPLALAVVAVPLLAWQLAAPVRDASDAAGDPSAEQSFHEPLLQELDARVERAPARIHVVPTRNRWEAVHVAERYPLARGWLRQAESDDFDLFQEGNLTPDAYLDWLRERAVSRVAVPRGVDLDYLAEDEAALIADGLPYLDLVWESAGWRLYRVDAPVSFVSEIDAPNAPASDARLASLGPESFELTAGDEGSYLVRVRWTRYWEVVNGAACIEPKGEWTRVNVFEPSLVEVRARFSLGGGGRCGP